MRCGLTTGATEVEKRTPRLAHFVDVVGHGQRDADEHEAGEDHKRRDHHHRLLDALLLQILLSTGRQRQRLPGGPEVARTAGGSGSGQRLRVDEDAGRPYHARRRGADLRQGHMGVASRSFKVTGNSSESLKSLALLQGHFRSFSVVARPPLRSRASPLGHPRSFMVVQGRGADQREADVVLLTIVIVKVTLWMSLEVIPGRGEVSTFVVDVGIASRSFKVVV